MKPPQSVKPDKRHPALVQVKDLGPGGIHCTQAQQGEKQHERSWFFAGKHWDELCHTPICRRNLKSPGCRVVVACGGEHLWRTCRAYRAESANDKVLPCFLHSNKANPRAANFSRDWSQSRSPRLFPPR